MVDLAKRYLKEGYIQIYDSSGVTIVFHEANDRYAVLVYDGREFVGSIGVVYNLAASDMRLCDEFPEVYAFLLERVRTEGL